MLLNIEDDQADFAHTLSRTLYSEDPMHVLLTLSTWIHVTFTVL